ncbi:hypothetical protein F4860DRAFT_512544 [Xylaria cubensis]|nr:hypothetical protein F4860DRAFT_512544 [Xylaria cubensis]
MASSVKVTMSKIADLIPGLRHRRKEEAEVFTHQLGHRYGDPAVLREALREMGFKDEDIITTATEARGLEAHLPRELTDQEVETIFKKFASAKYALRAPPKGVVDADDD